MWQTSLVWSKIIRKFSWNFLCGQRCRHKETKRNALDISEFRNQVHHSMILGIRWPIHFDRQSVIIYISLWAAKRPKMLLNCHNKLFFVYKYLFIQIIIGLMALNKVPWDDSLCGDCSLYCSEISNL